MPATTSCTPNCCVTPQVVNVPGSAGSSGVNGSDGVNAYTTNTSDLVLPAIGATVGVAVESSVWMAVGQHVVADGPANFIVTDTPTSTTVTLQFLGYPGDLAPAATITAGAVISPGGIMGGGWNMLSKSADQAVINSVTLTNDSALQFYMQVSTKYRARGVVFYDTTAAGDFQYGFTAPAAPTLCRFERTDCAPGVAPAERAVDVATPGATDLSGGGAGTTGGYIKFEVIFQNGANAAAFAFQFSQKNASSDTGAIVRAGSWLEWAEA